MQTVRALLILAIIVAGAILLSMALNSCQAPQVCKHCWVAGE